MPIHLRQFFAFSGGLEFELNLIRSPGRMPNLTKHLQASEYVDQPANQPLFASESQGLWRVLLVEARGRPALFRSFSLNACAQPCFLETRTTCAFAISPCITICPKFAAGDGCLKHHVSVGWGEGLSRLKEHNLSSGR
jgi:hypothetical protein